MARQVPPKIHLVQVKEQVMAIQTSYEAIIAANIRVVENTPERPHGPQGIGSTLDLIEYEFGFLSKKANWHIMEWVYSTIKTIQSCINILINTLKISPKSLHRQQDWPNVSQRLQEVMQRIEALLNSLQPMMDYVDYSDNEEYVWYFESPMGHINTQLVKRVSRLIGGTVYYQ